MVNRDGRLQKGDEILMINGHSLIAVIHKEVVDILRNSGSIVQLVIARKVYRLSDVFLPGGL